MDHLLPTMRLPEKETMLERVFRSMAAWQGNIIMLLPTQKLTSEEFETQQASTDEARLEYETAFTIGAVEVSYWAHQAGL